MRAKLAVACASSRSFGAQNHETHPAAAPERAATYTDAPVEDRSNAEIVDGCRRGDARAWETLVNRFERLVYAIPRRAGMDEQQAADVFQHVFASLFEHLGRIDDPDRLAAWLATTARRESWRVSRLSGRQSGADVDDETIQLSDSGALPGEALLELERQHSVRTAVARLDDRCRRLIGALFYADPPPAYSAIAREFAIPEGSIGPTRARCLRKLREILEREGG